MEKKSSRKVIFIEKKGRFGNFLFQFFLAKLIQKKIQKKIVIFSENENIYDFNSKNNIDSIVDGYFSLPKLSKFLNLWKKKCFYIQDENYKELINNEKFLNKNFIYLDGFFQEISLILENSKLLNDLINKNKIMNKNNFVQSDLTIHIRHLYHNLGSLDTNPEHQEQPTIDTYNDVIKKVNPRKIKVICPTEKNFYYKKLKEIYGDQIYLETKDDIFDFFNLMNSKNLVLSNSTYSLWASLLSKESNVYVPNIGVVKSILKKKKLNLDSNFIYL